LTRCVVLGIGDVASAVAHRLWTAGSLVVIVSEPWPTVTRRGMAFADAVFDGYAVLEGVVARRVETKGEVEALWEERRAIPILVRRDPLEAVEELAPQVLVDARMRKHAAVQLHLCGRARLTVGLGPGFVAGEQVDVAIETSWEELGRIRWEGANRPLAGEPRAIAGVQRERYVYAPMSGLWRTERQLGESVVAGEPVARLVGANGEEVGIAAPIAGLIRGLTRDGVPVEQGTKVLEIDPRGLGGQWRGIGERPRRIAEGVVEAVQLAETALRSG